MPASISMNKKQQQKMLQRSKRFYHYNSVKALPMKLQNKFLKLAVDDMSDSDTVNTGCTTTPISGASPTEHGIKAKPKVCLISCINYFVTIQIARKFIKKLSECIVPKKYFVQTL